MRTKGWLDALVLAVTASGPRHGYAIAADLRAADIGDVSPATLYPVLKKLEASGLVQSDWDNTASGPARKTYTATEAGRAALDEHVSEWQASRNGIDSIFARGGATA